jgi:hypothetical protein
VAAYIQYQVLVLTSHWCTTGTICQAGPDAETARALLRALAVAACGFAVAAVVAVYVSHCVFAFLKQLQIYFLGLGLLVSVLGVIEQHRDLVCSI